MKKGFTLVELLAVIIILAIIALITIPAVMRMIDNSTMNSYRRSVDLYGKAVSQAVVSYQSDMVEKGQSSNVTFDNIESYIEYEGNDVDCKIKQIYSDKTILLTECYVDEELVVAEKNKGYSDENYYYYTNLKKKMKTYEYINAVNIEIDDKSINGTCQVQEDKIICNNEEIKIKSNLENAIEGTLTIENSKVVSYNGLKFATEKKTETNNEVPQVMDEENASSNNQNNNLQEKYATLISDANNDEKVSIGDKYEYEVSPGTKYTFYVLSIEDDKVNLIMDRNICSNGGIECTMSWSLKYKDNTSGPDAAMKYLYNVTKNWINVPNIVLNYIDENNTDNITKGYTSITTNQNTKITTITGKNAAENTTIGTASAPLKARLPKESEVTNQKIGCHIYNTNNDYGTCVSWLLENSMYKGFWLLDSVPNKDTQARFVHYNGCVGAYYTNSSGDNGIRPVITVPISYLE